MKKYSGNLLCYLNEQTKQSVAAQKAADKEYAVLQIDAHDIIPNKKNFYGIRDIEGLAATMALSGHISPLEVTPLDGGKYSLISGERRRAAVLLRLERGEIEDAKVPCIVRTLEGKGKLSTEQMETINIICANDYREKTPFEKLDELTELEPIARIFYEDEKERGYGGDFRKFFAEKFLGSSIGSLQRILSFRKLVPEAREAFDKGLIKKTALSELAYKPEEVQREYLGRLLQGDASGTIEDVQQAAGQQKEASGKDAEAPAASMEAPVEKVEEAEEAEEPAGDATWDAPQGEETVAEDDETASAKAAPALPPERNPWESEPAPTPVPDRSLSPEEAKAEADNWVQQGICSMMLQAAEESEKAEQRGDTLAAAQWDLRRAAANFILETIR